MAALCQMVRAKDDSAYRYGASFCGSTICLFMAFSIPQIQWALPSFRFSDFCCQFCRRSPSSWVRGTQTACPSCLDSSYFDSDGTFFSFSFSTTIAVSTLPKICLRTPSESKLARGGRQWLTGRPRQSAYR